jgi:precorrin-6B methylase 2
MTLAFDYQTLFLICSKQDAARLDHLRVTVAERNGIGVFAINGNLLEYQILSNIPNLERYLDRFYIYSSNKENRQVILDVFFEFVAVNYDLLVDVERNEDNIRNLVSFLSRFYILGKESVILDYGCGTGLSVEACSKSIFTLVGFDRCEKMRQISRNRGLKVLTFEEIASYKNCAFAGIFASYVFHLQPNLSELKLIWTKLQTNGVLVANFHKNKGIEEASDCISKLGGFAEILDCPSGNAKRHGSYVAYRK